MPPPPVLEVGSDFDTSELLKQACQNFAITDGFNSVLNGRTKVSTLFAAKPTIACGASMHPWSTVRQSFASKHSYRTIHASVSIAAEILLLPQRTLQVKSSIKSKISQSIALATSLLTSNAIAVLKLRIHLRFEQRTLQLRQFMALIRTLTMRCLNNAATS